MMPHVEDWARTKEHYRAWWAGSSPFPLVQAYAPRAGAREHYGWDFFWFLRHLDRWREGPAEAKRYAATTYFGGEALPVVFANLGAGSLSAYWCGYLSYDAFNNTAWLESPQSWEAVEALSFNGGDRWWQYTVDVTRLVVEEGGGEYLVGMTDIGGILDVAASLRGTNELLLDLYHEPERVKRLSDRIEADFKRVYEELDGIIRGPQEGTTCWMGVWAPGTTYPIQCDFCAMVSPAHFEEFVAPSIQRQCRELAFPIYHWDGPGQIPHLDLLLEIPELAAIQWVPGAGVPGCDSPDWFPLYERILAKGKRLILQQWDDVRNVPGVIEALSRPDLVLVTTWFPAEAEARGFVQLVQGA